MKKRIKNSFTYGILLENTPTQHLHQVNTFFYCPFKKTKYALIERVVHLNNSEQCTRIIYSHSLDKLKEKMHAYPSWYNKVDGYKKELQGGIRILK